HLLQFVLSSLSFSLHSTAALSVLHSFPTRRSSDLSSGSGAAPIPCATPISFAAWRSTTCRSREDGADAVLASPGEHGRPAAGMRSEEHTSELQSRVDLVCRLLLEKKKT